MFYSELSNQDICKSGNQAPLKAKFENLLGFYGL